MAVPSSGELSLLGIRRELEDNNYSSTNSYSNTSLKECSDGSISTINTANASADRPDGSAPHAMSEFYSYDHDLAGLTSFASSGATIDCNNACGLSTNNTYYHDGSGTYPTAGDKVYTNQAGTNAASNGYYKHGGNMCYRTINGSGEVASTLGCRSERRLKTNIRFIKNSQSGIPIYHFEYKNSSHAPYGPGTYVGTMVDDLERLGYNNAIIKFDDGIFVDYEQIDVDCKLLN